MKLRFKYSEQFVGTFVLIALLIIVATIVYIVIDKKMFERKIVYKAKFTDASGLGATTPVNFKGFKIGVISNFKLTPDNYIIADFEVYEEFQDKIVLNSALFKSMNPVTSTSVIEFLQGIGESRRLQEGSLIPGIETPEGKALLNTNKVQKSGDVLTTLLYNIEQFSENLLMDHNPDKGAAFRALVNLADASEDLKSLVTQVNKIAMAVTKDHNPQDGTLFRALNNAADLTADLKRTVALGEKTMMKVDTLLTAYSKPDGLALRMIDPTGEILVKPLKFTFQSLNELLPKLQGFTNYLDLQKGDITIVLRDLKEVLRQANATFEVINSSPLINATPESGYSPKTSGDQLRPRDLEK